MEQQQRSLIFTAAVGLIILAIIVGSIYYLVKFIQGRVASNATAPEPSVTEIAQDFAASPNADFEASPAPEASAEGNVPQTGGNTSSQTPNKKVYNGGSFQLAYPSGWGILKCNNAQNFELDPSSSADSTVACDSAVKPVTVMVGYVRGCEGETTKIGNIDVTKAQTTLNGDTYYLWCTKTTPVLNITHRVSQQNKPAYSTRDYSKEVEEMISTLSVSRGS